MSLKKDDITECGWLHTVRTVRSRLALETIIPLGKGSTGGLSGWLHKAVRGFCICRVTADDSWDGNTYELELEHSP